MSSYFEEIKAESEFAQGDIIRRYSQPLSRQGVSWGFVLNADCDLAHGRNQGHISWLEIVTAQEYWQDIWAPAQLMKFSEKLSQQVCEQLNSIIKKSGIDVEELTHDNLRDWVTAQTPFEIMETLQVNKPDLEKKIQSLRNAVSPLGDKNSLDALETCQKLVGQDPKKNHTEFQKFMTKHDGFPDFFLVPNLPDGDAKGYVVLLRRMHGARETEVYKTMVDARVNDAPSSFHRIGRFSDGVRFQIAQKSSFLFSRIGSPKQFENDCRQVVEWATEDRGITK